MKKQYIIIIFLFFIYVFINNAWVGDDANITFRTIDNFVNGYGLRWNIQERVQSYTNPLWMLLLIPFYPGPDGIYYVSILFSFILSLSAIVLFLTSPGKLILKVFLIFCLLASKSFIDYTSSGLENSLNYFLISVFYRKILILNQRKFASIQNKEMYLLFFVAAMGFVSRQDNILLYFFPLNIIYYQYAFIQRPASIRNKLIPFLFTIPAVAWLLFAFVYYGSIFPNTYYAKLNTIEPFSINLKQAKNYFAFTLHKDTISLLLIFSSLIIAFRKRSLLRIIIITAILPYLLYIVYVGADFMGGRFFSYPVIMSVFFLLPLIDSINEKQRKIAFALLILYIILFPKNPFKIVDEEIKESEEETIQAYFGVLDEKLSYYHKTALIHNVLEKKRFEHIFYKKAIRERQQNTRTIHYVAIGMLGLYCGPNIIIIDPVALADPLLARLSGLGNVGHKGRFIPAGYPESLQQNKNLIEDAKLSNAKKITSVY